MSTGTFEDLSSVHPQIFLRPPHDVVGTRIQYTFHNLQKFNLIDIVGHEIFFVGTASLQLSLTFEHGCTLPHMQCAEAGELTEDDLDVEQRHPAHEHKQEVWDQECTWNDKH